jgi:DNA-binding Xre family transcriptional regulator
MDVIKVRIREVAQDRGITTAYQLQKLTGAQPSHAAKWYRNEIKSIGIETLNLLCRKLKCLPNDLLFDDESDLALQD